MSRYQLLVTRKICVANFLAAPPLLLRQWARSRHVFCLAKNMAERVGFEPTVPVSRDSRFRVGPVITTSVPLLLSSAGGKKSLHDLLTLLAEHPLKHLHAMIKPAIFQDMIEGFYRPCLFIMCPKDEA